MHRPALALALLAASLSLPAVSSPGASSWAEVSAPSSSDLLAAAPAGQGQGQGQSQGQGQGQGQGNAGGNGNGNSGNNGNGNGNPYAAGGAGNGNGNGNGNGAPGANGGAGAEGNGQGNSGTAPSSASAPAAEPVGTGREGSEGDSAAGRERRVEPAVEERAHGRVARAVFRGEAGEQVGVALEGADEALRGLRLRLQRSASVTVEVAVLGPSAPEARAPPPGFLAHRQLDIHVDAPDAGIAGGDLAFQLTEADLAGASPGTVVVLHGVGEGWEALPTSWQGALDGHHGFVATTPSFSPFLIAFDREPPAVRAVAPEGAVERVERITATIDDARGVDGALTRMLVDGLPVEARWQQGALVYEPVAALGEGLHVAAVSAVDFSGLSSLRSWSFTVVGTAGASSGADADLETATVPVFMPPASRTTATPVPPVGALLLVLALVAYVAAPRRR